jgi:hypothetical protein
MALVYGPIRSRTGERVPLVHRSSHAGNRWAPWTRFLAYLVGAVGSVGCSLKAGQGEACGFGVACSDGLTCSESTGTCIPISPPPPSCESEPSGCPGAQDAFRCIYGGTPTDEYHVNCAALPDSGDLALDEAIYCCHYVPHCDMLFSCGGAGVSFDCNDPIVPQDDSGTLQCAKVYSSGGSSSFCCTATASCFAANLFACGDAGQSFACTGNATPDQYGLKCSGGDFQDAGAAGTYCCETD